MVGARTICPFGRTVHPENKDWEETLGGIGEEEENVKFIGSNIPKVELVLGTKTTFPFGRRAPPLKAFVTRDTPVTGEYICVFGLYIPTVVGFPDGMKTIFPFGTNTPPLNAPFPTSIVTGVEVAPVVVS